MEVRFRLEFERQVVESCDAFKPRKILTYIGINRKCFDKKKYIAEAAPEITRRIKI